MLKISIIKIRKIINEGFTLVEVMMSVLILAIVLTGGLLLHTKGNMLMNQIQQRTVAIQSVQEKIELIRDMPLDNVIALGVSFTASGFNSLSNPIGTLTIDNPFISNDIRRVTAVVTWTSSQGRVLSTSGTTLITRSGINKQ